MGWNERLAALAGARRAAGLWRARRVIEERNGRWLTAGGRRRLDFASNDYLGLAADPRLSAALAAALGANGTGSGAARLVTGNFAVHETLEHEIAAWLGRDRALLFSSGYQANLALAQGLLQRGDVVLGDKLNHASLIDAARLGAADFRRYPHGDLDAARRLASAPRRGLLLIVSDGVFSMDGDTAPVRGLAALAGEHGALLAIDDAHGIGVLGETGRGVLEAAGAGQDEVPLLIGTFGKAFGTAGAFVAGPRPLIDHLEQTARTWIYTTAPPPALAAATLAALDIIRTEPERRVALHRNIAYFRDRARAAGLPLGASSSAIQPLVLGSAARTMAVAGALERAGFWVGAMRPPTVPEGTARLRITLSAGHETEMIERLVETLAATLDDHPAAPGG